MVVVVLDDFVVRTSISLAARMRARACALCARARMALGVPAARAPPVVLETVVLMVERTHAVRVSISLDARLRPQARASSVRPLSAGDAQVVRRVNAWRMTANRYEARAAATSTSVAAQLRIRVHARTAMMTLRVEGTVRGARAAQVILARRETAQRTWAALLTRDVMSASICLGAPRQARDPVRRATLRTAWDARAARVVPVRRVIAHY